MEATSEQRTIRPRDPGLRFEPSIQRHWFGGSPLATHLANGVNLLFPAGERFFVRSVRKYLDRIDDPTLRAQVKGFSGQEGRHARAHEDFFKVLESQGYKVKDFLRVYEKIAYGMIEPIAPAALRLSVTVAAEHFTAILAESALRDRRIDRADPTLRALLLWHAAEEIEHKSVAFDVLKKVNPSYALRMAGLALATVLLISFWAAGTGMFLLQDGELRPAKLRREADVIDAGSIGRDVFLRGIREYLRRDFHPSQISNDDLAREFFEQEFRPGAA